MILIVFLLFIETPHFIPLILSELVVLAFATMFAYAFKYFLLLTNYIQDKEAFELEFVKKRNACYRFKVVSVIGKLLIDFLILPTTKVAGF